MPFVLKHKETEEIHTCTLINHYDLEYHGVKAWNSLAAAEMEYASFLLEQGVDDLWNWEMFELGDNEVKIGNVRLNNNPSRHLYLIPEGKLQAR